MFCSNCGKQIPDNTRFCNHCGAAQNNGYQNTTQPNGKMGQNYSFNGNPNPPTSPKPPKKPMNKGLIIVISIAVIAVAFVIGYFATGANKLKRPTAFDVPETFEFDDFERPSIKENVTADVPDGSVDDSAELKKKTFNAVNDVGSGQMNCHYTDDGTVVFITGSTTCYDMSLTDIIEGFRSDATLAQQYLDELGESSSFVQITESEHDFTVYYTFDIGGAYAKEVSELAAKFLGFESQNGQLTIDTVERTLLSSGYTVE